MIKKYSLELIVLLALSSVLLSLIIITREALDNDDYQPLIVQTEKVNEPSIEILRQFDLIGDGYHLLYEELALPNTLQQVDSGILIPPHTGGITLVGEKWGISVD